MMDQLSLDQFILVKNNNIGKRQSQVYHVIKEFPDCSDQEISNILKIPINCITNRRGELEEKKLIACSGIKYNSRGRPVRTWRCTNIKLSGEELE